MRPVSDKLQCGDNHARVVVAMCVVVDEQIELHAEEREPADAEQQHDQHQHAHDAPLLLAQHHRVVNSSHGTQKPTS